ncbi:MAG: hypothetical protein KatS3mg042_0625 [Rhodothermaceae bacterium]|nr:MAG: hypothetical protein KatS3mg042_0625 [Rhodothermaceae bacterium]
MADFFLIADPDLERRRQYLTSARRWLEAQPGEPVREVVAGERHLAVRAPAPAPYREHRNADGSVLVRLGDEAGMPAPALGAGDTEAAFRAWFEGADLGMQVWMGADGSVSVAADLLGIFPVYFLEHAEVLLVASSPSLLLLHPACPREVDRVGLTSILLYSFPCGERTVWRAIRRLRPRHRLVREAGGPPRSEAMWDAREDVRPGDMDAHAGTFDRLFKTWAEQVTKPVNLQLSGGLDSRLVAGYLAGRPGAVAEAWTYGEPSDLEARAAARVAAACGWRHRVVPVPVERYPAWMEAQIDAGHLTNAVTDFALWALSEHAGTSPLATATGYLGDIVMGGNHIGRGIGTEDPEAAFGVTTARINQGYGLSPEAVGCLWRGGDGPELVAACQEELFATYVAHGGTTERRGWWFDLMHRDRHNVARLVLVMARHTWPLVPYCRPAVVRAALGVPMELLRARRLQRHLLARRFPGLASLPLDGGQLAQWAVRYPSRWAQRRYILAERLRERVRAWRVRHTVYEPRVNHRLWDMNRNPAWAALREQAYRRLDAVSDLFDVDVFRSLLPPPGDPVPLADPLQGAGLKTLVGVVLWSARYRP